ncbi:beta-ketoacyl-ACP synthase [Methyloprofundus sp.]|uniref:beta-ketoacyl-ACP synthase n=1 Tax=Methyloprofundus sp. TaxID=2020875 RepID=UPI003D0E579D
MKNNQTLIDPVAITAYSALSASGLGSDALYQSLAENRSQLAPLSLFKLPFPAYVGEIKQPLLDIREQLAEYNCRNARVALTALNDKQGGVRDAVEAAKEKYGAHRIGVIIGTSTSGLYETEAAYGVLLETGNMPDDFHFVTEHAYQATGRFVQQELGLTGVCYAISTACSSGAKAIAAGQRLINSGLCDAVIVGGVDTLCRLTLRGFRSLELVANQPCTPMDKNRQGISIGEAAGLMLLEKRHADNADKMKVLSVGESSDAHHMSTPHPEGKGAALAMNNALQLAGLKTGDIDYLNLHATATKINDSVESRAVYSVFRDQVPCSGTKGITGHTLGAAGALETIIALIALQQQFIPGTQGLQELDDNCQCQVIQSPLQTKNMHIAMSNSFGFGGNNASVVVAL